MTRKIPEVLGVGVCPSQGLRRGVVVDVESAAEAMGASLRRAEQQSGYKAMSAFVGIAGPYIGSTNSHGIVAIRHPDNLISSDDVERVIDGARIIQLPPDQEILHVIPRHFVVDGMDGIKHPVGMAGHRLEVEANIVTASTTSIHNLIRCADAVGIQLDGLVFGPLADGQAVLSDDERELGAMVIDIGGGTTDAAVFHRSGVIHACVLPAGGQHISNDLAFGLRATFPAVEELKIRHGSTIAQARPDGYTVPVPAFGRDEGQLVEQRTVAEIIDARLAETFELVQTQMERAGFRDCYPAGIILTGGSAQIPGAPELASEVFGAPSRLGAPQNLRGLADAVRSPAFSTSVGLLLWAREQMVSSRYPRGGGRGHVGSAFKAWLRNFFP